MDDMNVVLAHLHILTTAVTYTGQLFVPSTGIDYYFHSLRLAANTAEAAIFMVYEDRPDSDVYLLRIVSQPIYNAQAYPLEYRYTNKYPIIVYLTAITAAKIYDVYLIGRHIPLASP